MLKRKIFISAIVAFIIFLTATANATIYYVDPNGNDNNSGTEPNYPFATIQKGVDSTINGDTVLVADGRYTGTGNRNIEFYGKAITVRSENGPENCIIDCEGTPGYQSGNYKGSRLGFYFGSGEDNDSVVDGFTITKGHGKNVNLAGPGYFAGGAIKCKNSSPTIKKCIIENNYPYDSGGGISAGGGNPIIDNCVIRNNWVFKELGYGGGIAASGNLTIRNCVISNNDGAKYGGGIYVQDGNASIVNCVIGNNLISTGFNSGGGGIYARYTGSSAVLRGCTIYGNEGEGLFCSQQDGTMCLPSYKVGQVGYLS